MCPLEYQRVGMTQPLSVGHMCTHNVCVDMGWQQKIEENPAPLHALSSLHWCLGEHRCRCLLSQISMATVQAQIS